MVSVVKAIVCSVGLMLVYATAQTAAGLYTSLTYVPDVIHSYTRVDYLEHKVAFGVTVTEGSWGILPNVLWRLAAGVAVYYIALLITARMKKNSLR